MPPDPPDLFDRVARRHRFRRAARLGDSILLERMADDVFDRLGAVARPVGRLLVIGPERPGWRERLCRAAREVEWIDPAAVDEDRVDLGAARYDAALAVGSLDTVNQLGPTLAAVAAALRPGSPLLGALIGGHSLPRLRHALIDADRAAGRISPRSHPRIDPPTLAALLGAAAFAEAVVDVDRLTLRYATIERMVADLRAAGATNVLTSRSTRWPGRAWRERLARTFAGQADAGGRVAETIEILHFHGWSRTAPDHGLGRVNPVP